MHTTLLLHLVLLSITYALAVALEAAVCRRPFAQTARHANVNCNESLAWFKASGSCFPISAISALRLLSDILLLPCDVELLQPALDL